MKLPALESDGCSEACLSSSHQLFSAFFRPLSAFFRVNLPVAPSITSVASVFIRGIASGRFAAELSGVAFEPSYQGLQSDFSRPESDPRHHRAHDIRRDVERD